MRFLDPDGIRARFSESNRQQRKGMNNDGTDLALQYISHALADLKSEGLDVVLEMHTTVSELAFDLLNRQYTLSHEGVLRIGNTEHLLCIATIEEKNQHPCLKLALSKLDYRHQGVQQTVRSHVYDLQNDPDAMIKFQNQLIDYIVTSKLIEENDIAQVFNRDDMMRKPLQKPFQKLAPKGAK